MCLCEVDKKTKEVTEGWKVFKIKGNKLHGLFYSFNFETNKWLKDNKYYSIGLHNMEYKTGFHFYFNKKDAKKYIDRHLYNITMFKKLKIKVKNITATGLQYCSDIKSFINIDTAREIYIEDN